MRDDGRRRGPDGRPGEPGKAEHRRDGRAARGNVRAALLLLLAERPMHGYQLMGEVEERTRGAWRPSPGAIYPTIALLEDEGLVTVTPDSGRKLVVLSEAGRTFLRENAASIGDPFALAESQSADGRPDLRADVEQVRVATRAVGLGGTPEQMAAARLVLEQTRRSLYRILADDVTVETPPITDAPEPRSRTR